MFLSENKIISDDQINDFLSHRIDLINRSILNQDHDALVQILQEDRKNISALQSTLKELADSIGNIDSIQQYVCCMG